MPAHTIDRPSYSISCNGERLYFSTKPLEWENVEQCPDCAKDIGETGRWSEQDKCILCECGAHFQARKEV